jgi:predicted acetyltransferase
MLAAALDQCRAIGLQRILLCCAPDNEPSRRVIAANGGRADGNRHGEDRYWIELG